MSYLNVRPILTGLLSLVLLFLLLAGTVFANDELRLRGSITSGGGQLSAPGLVLQAGIGQPVASVNANQGTLCSGLFCGSDAPVSPPPLGQRVYLPNVTR